MRPYKDPWWLLPLELLIAVVMFAALSTMLIASVIVGLIGWVLGLRLYLDFRGKTYEVRWFSAKSINSRA